jgi:hypothetical protein
VLQQHYFCRLNFNLFRKKTIHELLSIFIWRVYHSAFFVSVKRFFSRDASENRSSSRVAVAAAAALTAADASHYVIKYKILNSITPHCKVCAFCASRDMRRGVSKGVEDGHRSPTGRA